MRCKRLPALLMAGIMVTSLGGCQGKESQAPENESETTAATAVADAEEKAYIEETLNLSNNTELSWTYNVEADAWVMSIVSAVAYPELPD